MVTFGGTSKKITLSGASIILILLSIVSFHDVYAQDLALSDQTSCLSLPVTASSVGILVNPEWNENTKTCKIVERLAINAGNSLTINPLVTLEISNKAIFDPYYGIVSHNGGLLNAGTTTNHGIIDLKGGSFRNTGTLTTDSTIKISSFNFLGAFLTNFGTMENSGVIDNNFFIENHALITNTKNGVINNYLQLSLQSNGVLDNFGTINNHLFLILAFAPSTLNNHVGAIINNFDKGEITIISDIPNLFNNEGIFNNLQGAIISNFQSWSNSGTTNNNVGGTINNGAKFTNSGTVANLGLLDNTGSIDNQCGAIFSGNLPIGNPLINAVCDKTAPIVTLTPERPSDSNGYYNHSVTFTLTGDDSTTGGSNPVSCDSPITYSGPAGNSITITGHCTDNAGNTGSNSVVIKYDSTKPTITAPADITIISKTPVSPPLGTPTVHDNLDPSPIVTNNAPATFTQGTTTIVTWTAKDHASNLATATQKVIIKTPGQAVNDLIIQGNSFGANTSVLGNAPALLNDSNPSNDNGACGKLNAFINQVNANHSLTL